MNKAELIDAVAAESGLSKADARRSLEAFVSITKEVLNKGDKVNLIGFGSFSTSERTERKGRNPRTGVEIQIKAKKVVKFKPGADLASAIN
tara:strand:- start:211 stop:483 length:273 start_codon:yes stop_codon:yes gene_type:complete